MMVHAHTLHLQQELCHRAEMISPMIYARDDELSERMIDGRGHCPLDS
jgi:hypothetical protein